MPLDSPLYVLLRVIGSSWISQTDTASLFGLAESEPLVVLLDQVWAHHYGLGQGSIWLNGLLTFLDSSPKDASQEDQ